MPVAPVRPVAAYLGGKRNLSGRLTARIEATPHTFFGDVFVGMGGVFFRRRVRPKAEAINDISGDVANLFRILQRHYQALMDMLRWQVTSRAEFERLMRLDGSALTDLERAVRFLYVQRLGFGGKVRGRTFGVSAGNSARFDVTKLEPMLVDVHERLAPVTIEQLHYAEFIRRYDRPGALFYLDPPYWNGEADYGEGVFERGDFQRLADQLADIRGRFILSINATDGTREAFGRFNVEEVEVTYTVSSAPSGKRVTELIVTGEH